MRVTPSTDTRFAECADCGHFPSWHTRGWRRILPWLSAIACQAWDPDSVDHKCQCRGWHAKILWTPPAGVPA